MLISQSSPPLRGKIKIPGDKSISHRALIIGASSVGKTRVNGLLEAEDIMATVNILRSAGVEISKEKNFWTINGLGVGGLASPKNILDFGNSGTSARLILGLLSTQGISAFVTGDSSLRKRPMNRVLVPLVKMGANFESFSEGFMPLYLRGTSEPVPIRYELSVPSAQVKSAILFAGLNTPGITTVIEPDKTRDHTENMLQSFGADILISKKNGGGRIISLEGEKELSATTVVIPGDPSSAAFPGVAALLVPDSQITIEKVGINPLRSGLIETLIEMGADIEVTNITDSGGEKIGDITFCHGRLNGTDVVASRAPSMIDEYPIAAIAAAFAKGKTRFQGLGELKVKESDRFKAIIDGLTACGVGVKAKENDIIIDGCDGPPPGGAIIAANLDHRIAMSYLVLGLASKNPVKVDGGNTISTSFPNFVGLMTNLGAIISQENA